MGIKKLNQQKALNSKVGFIGTVQGAVKQADIKESSKGGSFLVGKILLKDAKNPTSFTVFNTKKNPDLVDQVVAHLQNVSENIVVTAVPQQESYNDNEGNTRIATKLRVISLPDMDKLHPNNDLSTFTFMATHREDGTVYGESEKNGPYLVFMTEVQQTWFDQGAQESRSKSDLFQLHAFGDLAAKIAEEHAETPDGTMVQGRVGLDGSRLILKSVTVAPPVTNDVDLPF